ncbi:MAG: DUF4143 domain-containing protein [Saprospiraceae bacterium]
MFELAVIIFENLIIADFVKRNHHHYLFQEFWFWRDSNGNEVDLLTRDGQSLKIYEIKSSQTINSRYFHGMDLFSGTATDKISAKTLIYGGNESQERTHYQVRAWRDSDDA